MIDVWQDPKYATKVSLYLQVICSPNILFMLVMIKQEFLFGEVKLLLKVPEKVKTAKVIWKTVFWKKLLKGKHVNY